MGQNPSFLPEFANEEEEQRLLAEEKGQRLAEEEEEERLAGDIQRCVLVFDVHEMRVGVWHVRTFFMFFAHHLFRELELA